MIEIHLNIIYSTKQQNLAEELVYKAFIKIPHIELLTDYKDLNCIHIKFQVKHLLNSNIPSKFQTKAQKAYGVFLIKGLLKVESKDPNFWLRGE